MQQIFLENMKKNIFVILIGLYPVALVFGTALSECINLILIISFLHISYQQKEWGWLKNKIFIFLLIIYAYLIINFIFAHNPSQSFSRAFGFIRFPILIFALPFFFKQNENSEKIISKMWFFTISLIVLDLYFEVFMGHNIMGYKSPWSERLSGMMKNELKIAHLLIGFSLPTLFFILENDRNYKKFFILLLLFLIILILTGERANTLKGILIICSSILFYQNIAIRLKKIFIIICLITFGLLIYLKPNIHQRYFNEINEAWKNSNSSIINIIKDSNYGPHYQLAWKIFKSYPISGVGIKNFRIECTKKIYEKIPDSCTTHPHQIYFEFLSELGILGFLFFSSFFGYILLRAKYVLKKNSNGVLLSTTMFIFATAIPVIPSGSFFTSFGATIFWINIAIINKFLQK